jgi:hypothetical protein
MGKHAVTIRCACAFAGKVIDRVTRAWVASAFQWCNLNTQEAGIAAVAP